MNILGKKYAQWLRENLLLGVVFLTGTSILIIEVVATRILSPYFGNTIYTFSSVLCVVLAALSVGYYTGGKLADRHPVHSWFYGLIYIAAITGVIMIALSRYWMPTWAYGITVPLTTGPLVASMILFIIPCIFLGMISPYAITLQESIRSDEGIGSIAGTMFFWSTLGSIVGSLSAGFILIPNLGLHLIIALVCVLLFVIAIIGFWYSKISIASNIFLTAGGIACSLVALGIARSEFTFPGLLYSENGVYEKISVVDTTLNAQSARILLQDRTMSSGVYLEKDDLAFEYSRYFKMYPLLQPNVRNVLVIGAGAYIMPMEMLTELPDATIDVVEIEKKLEEVSKEFFGLTDNPRLKLHFQDGRRFLHNQEHPYDIIFGDAYSSLWSLPSHLATQEYFQTAKEKLNPDGFFIGNFIGTLTPEPPSLIPSIMKTFQSVFPNSYFFAVRSHTDDRQNIIFVGYNSDTPVDFCGDEASKLDDEFHGRLCLGLIDTRPMRLDEQILLTDEYAPVDALSSKMFFKEKN